MPDVDNILIKEITSFGQKATFVCDKKCNKAFGVDSRPSAKLSDDEDDTVYLTDGELGDAQACTGTWEGGHGKPKSIDEAPNKWCVRQCERSSLIGPDDVSAIDDFTRPVFNSHERADSPESGNKKIPI